MAHYWANVGMAHRLRNPALVKPLDVSAAKCAKEFSGNFLLILKRYLCSGIALSQSTSKYINAELVPFRSPSVLTIGYEIITTC